MATYQNDYDYNNQYQHFAQNPNQYQYQPPQPQMQYAPQPINNNVSIGDWIITLIIMCIPIVGLVMLFVWAFGSGTPAAKANWAKAQLIFALIAIILVVIVFVVFGASILTYYNLDFS